MKEPHHSYVLTEQGQEKFNEAKKDFGNNLKLWFALSVAGGYSAFTFLDQVILNRFISSYSMRRKYSTAIGTTFFFGSFYHGYKLSNRRLLMEKFKIRKNPENIVSQLY